MCRVQCRNKKLFIAVMKSNGSLPYTFLASSVKNHLGSFHVILLMDK